jgi:hypothetical protein
MSRGKASGITLYKHDARIVLGMVARGDRDHDIAAWFGVNQGRIAEVKAGEYGVEAVGDNLPPSGPPGPKGFRLRNAVEMALALLDQGGRDAAKPILQDALSKYDSNEG